MMRRRPRPSAPHGPARWSRSKLSQMTLRNMIKRHGKLRHALFAVFCNLKKFTDAGGADPRGDVAESFQIAKDTLPVLARRQRDGAVTETTKELTTKAKARVQAPSVYRPEQDVEGGGSSFLAVIMAAAADPRCDVQRCRPCWPCRGLIAETARISFIRAKRALAKKLPTIIRTARSSSKTRAPASRRCNSPASRTSMDHQAAAG